MGTTACSLPLYQVGSVVCVRTGPASCSTKLGGPHRGGVIELWGKGVKRGGGLIVGINGSRSQPSLVDNTEDWGERKKRWGGTRGGWVNDKIVQY